MPTNASAQFWLGGVLSGMEKPEVRHYLFERFERHNLTVKREHQDTLFVTGIVDGEELNLGFALSSGRDEAAHQDYVTLDMAEFTNGDFVRQYDDAGHISNTINLNNAFIKSIQEEHDSIETARFEQEKQASDLLLQQELRDIQAKKDSIEKAEANAAEEVRVQKVRAMASLRSLDDLASNIELGWAIPKILAKMSGRYLISDTVTAEKLDVEGKGVIESVRFAPVSFYGEIGYFVATFDRRGHATQYIWSHDAPGDLIEPLIERAGIGHDMRDDATMKDFTNIISGLSSTLGKPKRVSDESSEFAIWTKKGNRIWLNLKEGDLTFLVRKP